MLGFRFVKAPPTTHVMLYHNGEITREGPGLSLIYFDLISTLVAVPLESVDVPFAFMEVTADFQTVTVQGQLTYRVRDPRVVAGLLDFSADHRLIHLSDGPEKLQTRLVQVAQVVTRSSIQGMTLKQALTRVEEVATDVIRALQESPAITMLGVEVLAVTVVSIQPTPEMSRALEAEAREALQRAADEAIYDRRNAAVEQERRIRESELNTELAVEAKRRQIREAQMAADIAVEEQRTQLLSQRLENDRQEADTRAYALEAVLKPVREVDWKTLMAVSGGGTDSRLMIAVAFRELAENAQKIGELNMSPDLLRALVAPRDGKA
ncbi:MAG: SPFH domain-containing protein [Candidatus Eremiobacterota bacterium]